MRNPTRPVTALVALVMATSACAVASETSDSDAGVRRFVGVCAPEFPDCVDTLVIDQGDTTSDDLFPDGEPREGVDKSTLIQVDVGPHFASAHDDLQPGDPLAGASVRLFQGDIVVFETLLDSSGTASIAPEPGWYTVQVSLDSAAPGGWCSWGNTIQDVSFPQPTVVFEASYMCAGS